MSIETVYLVPHTHWDREWYEPFQRFRLRLVGLLDDVVARAEADPDFHFTLDGQLAAVDDYLEVRPEAAGRVANLVHSGQFAIGPWAILLDEFLCSGESIVRNLESGLRRAAELGGAMPIGYLPDMFGHAAQMPQILAGAGLRQACVWRGVPASVTRHAFVWQAPDGTGIRTEYLPGGYGNAAGLFADPDHLAEGTGRTVARLRPWFGTDPILAMYGTDHSAPLPGMATAVRNHNANGDGAVRLRLSTLAGYLSRFDPDDLAGLPVVRGELRSHARANILPGVLSNRPHLKRALSHAERMVERYAEPLAALWTAPDGWPARLLEMAWRRLIESSCHDSVTGCGVDETAVQVAARIAEAEQIGSGVRDAVLAGLAAAVPAGSCLVANPSPYPRTGLIRVAVPALADRMVLRLPDGTAVETQFASGVDGELLFQAVRPAAELAGALREGGGLGLEFLGLPIRDVALGSAADGRELVVTMGLGGAGLTAAHRALGDAVEAAGGDWRLRVAGTPRREAFAAVPLPPLGWTTLTPYPAAAGTGPGQAGAAPDERVTVDRDGTRMTNGRLTVSVRADGTLTLAGPGLPTVTGVGRLVDGGDAGDLYNYAPAAADEPVIGPDPIEVTVSHRGPLVGALTVDRTYRWGAGGEPVRVRTEVELRAGEQFCRLAITFENRRPDHRLRWHVPLPGPADTSYAEGQFAVVARGRRAEGGHGEVPLPTYPAYGFVDAGGVAVLLDQVSEYEVVAGGPSGGDEIAVTLLRATGLISRAEHPLRAEPAGPVIDTPAAQCIGQVITTRLAVLPHQGGWADAGVPAAAEAFRLAPVAVETTGPSCPAPAGDAVPAAAPAGTAAAPGGTPAGTGGPVAGAVGPKAGTRGPASGVGLSVTGTGVTMTSLRRRDPQWLEVRVVAMTGAATAAVLAPVSAARRADLLGRPGPDLPVTAGTVRVPLRPWEIATIQLAVPPAGDR